MEIKVFNNNPMATNTYVVNQDKSALIIDPTGNLTSITRYLETNQLEVKYILLTHGHADHIDLVQELRARTGAPLLIHAEDEEMINSSSLNLSDLFHNPMEFESDIQLEEGQKITLGDIILEVIHTPGHTKGSICILAGDSLFTGDTLFKGSIGRTDFPGGDYATILNSLEKIKKRNPELKVYPGHGEPSVLKVEIATNPYFRK